MFVLTARGNDSHIGHAGLSLSQQPGNQPGTEVITSMLLGVLQTEELPSKQKTSLPLQIPSLGWGKGTEAVVFLVPTEKCLRNISWAGRGSTQGL